MSTRYYAALKIRALRLLVFLPVLGFLLFLAWLNFSKFSLLTFFIFFGWMFVTSGVFYWSFRLWVAPVVQISRDTVEITFLRRFTIKRQNVRLIELQGDELKIEYTEGGASRLFKVRVYIRDEMGLF